MMCRKQIYSTCLKLFLNNTIQYCMLCYIPSVVVPAVVSDTVIIVVVFSVIIVVGVGVGVVASVGIVLLRYHTFYVPVLIMITL